MILVDTHGDCFVQLSSLNPLGYRGQYVRTSDGRLFQEREIDVAYQALSLQPFNGHDEDDEPDYVATVNLDGYENAIWDT